MTNRLVKVAETSAVPEEEGRIFDADGISVVVCNVGGNFYAIENLCSHQDEVFEDGTLEGCEIECPHHGAMFDVTTGEATLMPGVSPVETFPVHIKDGIVSIEIDE